MKNNLQTTQKNITFKRWLTAKTFDGTWERERDYRNTPEGERFKDDWILERQPYCNIYETPALFTNSNAEKRGQATLFAVDWLWVDVDGVEGATTGDEAAQVIQSICEKNDFPQPNKIICTSEGAGRLPRVSLWWKIEPVMLQKEAGRSLWRDVAHRLCAALKVSGLSNVDVGASTNLVGVMRLEGSKHSTTGTVAHRVGEGHDDALNIVTIKSTLPKPSNTYVPQHRRELWSSSARTSRPIDHSIMENEQMEALADVVCDGQRNHALYALVKAKQAAGFTLGETRDWAKRWNDECDPPEDSRKVDDVVQRVWGDELGISAMMIAETATAITGHKFKPDPRLIVVGERVGPRKRKPAQPTPKPRRRPGPRATKRAQLCHDLPQKVGDLIKNHLNTGKAITLAMIATAAGEKRDSLRRPGRQATLFQLIERLYNVQLLKIDHGWSVRNAEPKTEGQGYDTPLSIKQQSNTLERSNGVAGSCGGVVKPPGRGGGGIGVGSGGSRGRKSGIWSKKALDGWLKATFGTSNLQRIMDEKNGV